MVNWLALAYWLVASWAARFCSRSASWFNAWVATDAVGTPFALELAPFDDEAPDVDDVEATDDALTLAVPSEEVELSRVASL